MTNLQAYMAYHSEEDIANLTLSRYAINPSLDDMNQVSAALGMIDKSVSPDYKQGSTSETLPASARKYYYSRGKAILASNGIVYIDGGSGVVITTSEL